MEYLFHIKYRNKLVIIFDKQVISWTTCEFFNSWIRQSSERETMWEVWLEKLPIRPLRVKQNGRTAGDGLHMLTATQVAGPERLILHAQRCPVILFTSGTFLPLGQSCVYFQGAVFFPGPSWPRAKAFGRDPHWTKGPGIPAVCL